VRADRFDELAGVVERLAVLLAAGVPSESAIAYLDDPRVDALARGEHPRDPAWRGLAAAWRVASAAGAPLASTLDRFARSLRELGQNDRDARTALAGPRATARLVMVLPIVGVLFGLALGFDTIRVLFTTPIGIACVLVGVALLAIARFWNRRLLVRAARRDPLPGLGLDLVAIALSGGASMPRALETVARVESELGLARVDGVTIEQTLALSIRAGVPAAGLLRSAAEQARREARSAGERAAATLGVTLMLPLGLCVLPSFMLLGVAPLVLAVLSSTARSFA
jgi:tight adherence protein B